jgi:hypothetical protein
MVGQSILRLRLDNIGPIEQARLDLYPLTVLIGPNNVGKSYIAQAAYAVLHSLEYYPLLRSFGREIYYKASPKQLQLLESTNRKELAAVLKGESANPEASAVRAVVVNTIHRILRSTAQDIDDEMCRCFATSANELIRVSKAKASSGLGIQASIVVKEKQHAVVGFHYSEKAVPEFRVQIKPSFFDIKRSSSRRWVWHGHGLAIRSRRENDYADFILEPFDNACTRGVHYLPAGRCGLLASHRAMAAAIVHRASRAGAEPLNVPMLSGLIADYISDVLLIDTERLHWRGHDRLANALSILENKVLKGRIRVEPAKSAFLYPEITYDDGSVTVPISRASSMAAEAAPLAILMKYRLQEGSTVIIEEPEGHLHPDNQRNMARTIAALVRSNVRVIITTHSDQLAQHISNMVLLSTLSDKERHSYGYSDYEYLNPDEIGFYSVKKRGLQGGATVEKIKFDSKIGIPLREFAKHVGDLYDESERILDKVNSQER